MPGEKVPGAVVIALRDELFQMQGCGQSGKVSKTVNSSIASRKMRRTC
jgi:hypothetical protein